MKRFLRKISRVVSWLPVIWKGAWEYDYGSLYNVMYHQLGRMADFFESDRALAAIPSPLEHAVEIREVMELIEKQRSQDWYYDEYFAPIEEKWGEIEMHSQEFEDDSSLVEIIFRFSGVNSKADELKADEEWAKARQAMNAHMELDFNYIWELFKANLRKWWD